jgi:hypothetical protein
MIEKEIFGDELRQTCKKSDFDGKEKSSTKCYNIGEARKT